MTLTVEDGSEVAGAESYITVADALTYHDNLGNNTWATITEEQQEQALRRATNYMLQAYGSKWQGVRMTATQSLDWPRSGVYAHGFAVATDAVPVAVQNACAELALKAAAGELLSDKKRAKIRVKVDVIETEYDRFASHATKYEAVEAILAPYFKNVGGVEMVRI